MTAMSFEALCTELALFALMLAVLGLDLLMPRQRSRRTLYYLTTLGLGGVLLLTAGQYHLSPSLTFIDGLFIVDNYAIFFKQLFLVAMLGVLTFLGAEHRGEFFVLLLSALLGMCVLVSANDFLTMFIGLELMTVSFYVLVSLGSHGDGARLGSEAGVKYLLFGAGSTAVMLYGVSLIYGSAGSLMYVQIPLMTDNALCLAGLALLLAGFFFKLSAVPFHMWAPDVYQGAPTSVTALLAMCSKAAGLAACVRVLFTAYPWIAGYWSHVIAVVSALSIIGGNLMAIRQTDVKRMLAYSSMAQAGYMLAGLAAATIAGLKSVMFYATIYMFANLGAFAVLSNVERERGGTTLTHLTGLGKAAPVLAAVMSVSLLSMAGIPPTAGFSGKMYLFLAAVDRGYLWLALVGFVLSMVSVYYYLMVVKAMYRDLEADEQHLAQPFAPLLGARLVAVLAMAMTLVIGLRAESLATLTNLAAITFGR